MMKRIFMTFLVLSVGVIVFNSCYPNRAEFVDELDIAATDFDPTFDFASLQNYYLPDQIVVIDDDEDEEEFLDPELADPILDQIEANMEAYGFERLDEASQEQADVVLLVSTVSTENLVLWWDYWGWWPGWGYYPPGYGPGWGWGYPWGGVSGYSYTTGSLIIQMVDPNNPDEGEQEVSVEWLGVVNGLIQGSDASLVARANRGVDQLFLQSPYLDLN